MVTLTIKRKKAMAGSLAKMPCYINDVEVASLKNGETMQIETAEQPDMKFSVELVSGKAEVHLDLTGRDALEIEVQVGTMRPLINVSDKDAVIETPGGKDKGIVGAFRALTENSAGFKPTKKVNGYFGVNENDRTFGVTTPYSSLLSDATVYKYTDLISFEVVEDGFTLADGGVGRALVGGLLFGGAGAIVGAVTPKKVKRTCNSLAVRINLNNMDRPVEVIRLIDSPTDKNSWFYRTYLKKAQDIASMLMVICRQNELQSAQQQARAPETLSGADEIRKYRALLDEGIITEEEFEAKKKQILDL